MGHNVSHLDARSPIERLTLPGPPPESGQDWGGLPPAEEFGRLRSAAEGEAHTWTAANHSSDLLKQKWEEASKAIQAATQQYSNQPADSQAAPPTDAIQSSFRLLESALAGTEELGAQQLPVVSRDGQGAAPRAYLAVGAYFRAAHFNFQADSLVAFFRGIQNVQPLKLQELYALKPLAQLVLLEQIGHAVGNAQSGIEDVTSAPGDASGSAMPLPDLTAALRAVDTALWPEIIEKLGEVNRILSGDPCGGFAQMDLESRTLYLQKVDRLGRFSDVEEIEVARLAVALAYAAYNQWSANPRVRDRRGHVGYYLIGEGRELLEEQIHYRPPFVERVQRGIRVWPEIFYFVGLELLTFGIIAFLVIGARSSVSLLAALLLLTLPATEAAWAMMNQVLAFLLPAQVLPKLDFSAGIPRDCATLVVVPTLLTNEAYTRRLVNDLEIRYLGNRDPNIYFALLTDAPDSQQRFDQTDELVALCSNLITELNTKYARDGNTPFLLLHRFRTFNESEGAWMGWERKRGKILDLNNLLRGDKESFPIKVGNLAVLPRIRYVIPVDSDTQLPRDVARRLVATLAHPLNRAVVDPQENVVVEGYGMLQPRVGISVQSASRSLLASIYSGQTGMDLYTHAISNVYQDLFGEGTFVGKGIYEVDVFRQVLGQRFPRNAILSHDLIEGNYLRCGLASDIEMIDDYPTHFSAYCRRKHRWVRGDWQIMWWLLPRVPDASGKRVANPLPLVARWKIFDNLRRSLGEVATFVLLLAGWLSLPGSPRRWTFAVIVLLLIPTYLQLGLALSRAWTGPNLLRRLKSIFEDFIEGQINVFFMLVFLSHQTLVVLDAIVRTIVRVTITRKKLLEWETAAQAEVEASQTPVDLYLKWTPWLSLVIAALLAVCRRQALMDAAPFLVLWACAGPLARWLNRPLRPEITRITGKEEHLVRGATLRTWRYFRQYACEGDNSLIPDNIQERPLEVDHRISPTNLGLQLNSQFAAYELGYLTLPEFVTQVEKTWKSLRRLPRFRGHFLNWYNTQTLQAAGAQFVSTVDNGNLLCSLWIMKQSCLRARQDSLLRDATWQGLRDHINLLDELAARLAPGSSVTASLGRISAQVELLNRRDAWIMALPSLVQDLREVSQKLINPVAPNEELAWWLHQTVRRTEAVLEMIEVLLPWLSPQNRTLLNQISGAPSTEAPAATLRTLAMMADGIAARLDAIQASSDLDPVPRFLASSLSARIPEAIAEAGRLQNRLAQLASEAQQTVQEMDFSFLFDPVRKLLSLGYDVDHHQLQRGCYDLLMSEARSAVFAAIAKGDVPQETWLQLGRPHGAWEGERLLLSWSGTMFEYLMPALWLKDYPRSALGRSIRAAVRCQRARVPRKGMPWGISESSFSTRSADGHYGYQAFGVPDLSLDPGLNDDMVISPYSTFLALSVDSQPAVQNLQRMQSLDWMGELGFYDAVDFAPSRVPAGKDYVIAHCWMAHHQGMSMLAACNLLADGVIQKLFHAEPAVTATELLLQEKPSHTAPCVQRLQSRRSGIVAAA